MIPQCLSLCQTCLFSQPNSPSLSTLLHLMGCCLSPTFACGLCPGHQVALKYECMLSPPLLPCPSVSSLFQLLLKTVAWITRVFKTQMSLSPSNPSGVELQINLLMGLGLPRVLPAQATSASPAHLPLSHCTSAPHTC